MWISQQENMSASPHSLEFASVHMDLLRNLSTILTARLNMQNGRVSEANSVVILTVEILNT